MKPKYHLGSTKMFNDEWFTDGYFMIKRSLFETTKQGKKIAKLKNGTYRQYGRHKSYDETLPDFNAVIPTNLNGYEVPHTVSAIVAPDLSIQAYKLESASTICGLGTNYIEFLTMVDEYLIADPLSPIVLKKKGELVGLLMPYKLNQEPL